MNTTSRETSLTILKRIAGIALLGLMLGSCHGHLKHIDGPGNSEDAPGQQKKY